MSHFIHLLKYYPPRNYFLRIFQFLFWFLSYYFDKGPAFVRLSLAISDSRAIMNLFSIIEKIHSIFSKSVFFKDDNKTQKLLYITYITSFCHILIHSICFIAALCGYDLGFLEKLYNAFYTCTMLINLIRYKIELEEIDIKEKERIKIIKLGILVIGFNLPLALNGTGLILKIFNFKLNKPIEGLLGVFASIIQFYIASSKHLIEIKQNYINRKKSD